MEPISFLGFYEPVSSLSHFIAAGAALLGGYFLLKRGRGSTSRIVSLSLFTFCMFFLFSMSGVFHLLPAEEAARGVLQRLDHAGIWLMIAGTFTPIHVILFRGPWRWGILIPIWIFATVGLIFQVTFFHDFPEWLILTLFLVLGWMGLFTMFRFYRKFSHESLNLMVGGTLLYSVGAVIDFAKWPILIEGVLGPHEIFHLMIVLAAFLFWYFIYEWSSHPVKDKLYFYVHVYPDGKHIAKEYYERMSIQAPNRDALRSLIRESVKERYHLSYNPQIKLTYSDVEYL